MSAIDAVYYVALGISAMLVVAAIATIIAGIVGYLQARRDAAEVERIVGDWPRTPDNLPRRD